MRRIPLVPTLIVGVAVAVMIALGVWQLQRLAQKEALLERYAAASAMSADVNWPRTPAQVQRSLFRHTRVECGRVIGRSAVAGRSLDGKPGWAQVARCELAGGGEATVALGWSSDPREHAWSGGEVFGTIAAGPRLVAGPPLAGLEPLASPNPRDIPNNHFAYAVQWFLFAAVAAAIYALALRKRLAPTPTAG
jgi:surfeit locus 1 family protein